jgi:hypothetical protein
MSDGELRKIATDAGSLSENAVRALAEEAQRRGVDIVIVATAVPIDEVEQQELVIVAHFRDLPEALLAKGALESAGIECYLVDDNMVRLDWFWSNLLGGVKLAVKQEDTEEALNVLEQPIPEDFDVDGSDKYQQPRCPNCQSLDISFEAMNKLGLATAWAIGVPLPLRRNAWRCNSCGRAWRDDESTFTT